MAQPEPRAAARALSVEEGVCHALFAYDVGRSIDLDEAERRITALTQRAAIRHKRRAARYFQYEPAPLRVTQEGEALVVGAFRTASSVDAVLYDFGAVSVSYRLAIAGPLADLAALNIAIHDDARLLADARQRVEQLVEAIRPAVAQPAISDAIESYAIFQVERFAEPCTPAELSTSRAQEVAQLLRAEAEALSPQEVEDAVACRISFGLEDVTLVDWEAALVFDRDADDVLAVLEFGNVELLEMRFLDRSLDDALDRSYDALARGTWRWLPIPGWSRGDLRSVGQMQVDSAMLFEGVNNALKLLGDQYLARVYGLVSRRFHLAEWDASILRKLGTLESIYEKMSDRVATFRLEALEWMIVILIAVSIVLPFIPGMPGH
jgi:hypothetical protein